MMDDDSDDDDDDDVKGKHIFAALDGTLGTETDEEHQPHKNGRWRMRNKFVCVSLKLDAWTTLGLTGIYLW